MRKTGVFDRAPPSVECVDVWHPGTLTWAARQAYDALAAQGRIRLIRAARDRTTGRIAVRYLSDVPHEWILPDLAEEKRAASDRGQQTKMEVGQ